MNKKIPKDFESLQERLEMEVNRVCDLEHRCRVLEKEVHEERKRALEWREKYEDSWWTLNKYASSFRKCKEQLRIESEQAYWLGRRCQDLEEKYHEQLGAAEDTIDGINSVRTVPASVDKIMKDNECKHEVPSNLYCPECTLAQLEEMKK